jgi:hypothetical protein
MTFRENDALPLDSSSEVELPLPARDIRRPGMLRGGFGTMMNSQPDDLMPAAKFHLCRRWSLMHRNCVVKLDGRLFDSARGDASRCSGYFGVRRGNRFSQGRLRCRYCTLIRYGIGEFRHQAAGPAECHGGESAED